MLLILRVDRNMPWRDLALIMMEDSDAEAGAAAVEREAARLRKRFERIKADLKHLATRAGLIP